MADERIDIEIGDKVSPNVRKKVLEIADAARRADSAVARLKTQLASIDDSALNKLANASAKVTNALARETNAQARLTSANARMTNASNRAALSQQKLATEAQRTAAAQSRATAAQHSAAAASSRAELAALRLKTAQEKLNGATDRSNRSLGNFVRTAAAFAGIGFSGAAIISAADSYTILENKLRNVVDTEQQLVEVTNEVFAVANRTRAPVQDTAQAFQRFDLALQQLGASQRESLQLTETVNQALILSGSTTNEQASALLQLSQAFNKGKLDGDEFRTVMELMPSVADAIAKQLNVTRGELLNLAPQGKITAEVMRQAFANAREEIADRFGRTIPTLGQAFVVLKNNATQFFGEINKSLGITEAMSRAILFLADNFKAVGVALAVLSAALLVAFGPTLIAGIVAATGAVKAFTLAIAANPIGLLIVGLTTAIALFAAFKDDIKVSEDGVVSLGDTVSAVFQLIGEVIAPVVQFFKDVWNSAFNEVSDGASSFVGMLGTALRNVVNIAKTIVNGYIAIWVGAYNVIIKAWDLFPGALKDIVVGAVNAVITVVEKMINGVLNGLNKLLALANDAAEFVGLNPIFNTDIDVDLSRFKGELTGAARELGGIVQEEFSSAFNTDFIGNAVGAVSTRAREIANQRIAGQQGAGSQLRAPTVPTMTTSDPAATKAAEKRADALAKVNRELDSEVRLLGLLGPERELQQRFEQINNELLNKKITLTAEERRGIMEKLQLIQREEGIQGELNNIYNEGIGQIQQIAYGLEAINRAYERGIINAEQYTNRLAALNVEAANLKIQMGDGSFSDVFVASMGKIVEGYDGALAGMTDSFGDFFNTLSDGFADSIGRAIVYGEDLEESLKNVARSALSELISALVKVGIQYLVNAALGQSVAAATAATNAAVATSAAAAWAPAAALASLATLGANAAGAAAAITSTMALSEGMALASVAGFESGGYTGNVGRKEIAGVVHGQEYVVNAAATARNRDTLEAMNRGATAVSLNSQNVGKGGSGVELNVFVENYGSSEISVEQISETDVRIIARDVASKTVRDEAPGVVAADIGNPNGRVSRSLNQNTNVQRRR
ncbi:MAG: hypothetical protein CMH23_07040 [Methylophaga sp.]|uniref:tape measure protein n=1 Tax=Methylophaga sp. TaxID=2024840 RepID=UPI000C89DAB5|nr:tape measure protein [Methylophaga sp.]MBN46214.1 hypothetical protein [Methylophaga sp.]QDP56589.1 MAG: putative tail tape measure protein [Prokaryotic dsDNA virus sp.]|tara:strand:- start:14041 stop:17277 length:3237 start_codon:yes stop_codon:yes gene_type:complete